MLFEEVARAGKRIKPGETTFEFLQRSERPGAAERCSWIETWFSQIPDKAKKPFKARLQSKDSDNFHSALFELQVHTMLSRLGCQVKIEPKFPGTNYRPDFCAYSDRAKFCIEATMCGFGQGYFSASPNEDDAVEKIRRNIRSPHSDIFLYAQGSLRTTLGTNRVVRPFKTLLDQYTADEVVELNARLGTANAPSISIAEGNWSLTGSLRPQMAPHRGGLIIGPSRSGMADGWTYILNSLSRKADKWKNVDLRGWPFLIAVNVCHSEFDWYEPDIRRALFSDREPVTGFHDELSFLSGVIVFENVVLGNEIGARVKLYQNGESKVPECLTFLLEEQRLGSLLGIEF